jgi:hypothetical protein
MGDSSHIDIESELLEAVRIARVRHEDAEQNLNEYVACLKRLNDFLIHGTVPGAGEKK